MEVDREPCTADVEGMRLDELRDLAERSACLMDRSRLDLGRALNAMREQGGVPPYSSVAYYAEAELGLSSREAWHLMRIERETRKFSKLREAWARGAVSYSNVRTLIGIVTEDDEQEWVSFAADATWRQLWHRAKQTGHERAEKQEIAWPETGIYGELGRPSPFRRLNRPYPKWLYDIEGEVMEMHNTFYHCNAGWVEFMEALLESYRQELQTGLEAMASEVREVLGRDGYTCRIPFCGHRHALHRHHVIYRCRGGSDETWNLATVCEDCHRLIHAGYILVESHPSDGFRFARRAHLDDRWEYCADEPCRARPLDPHALAWDLEDSGVAEDGVERPRRPWPTGVRGLTARYGGRVQARLDRLVSERAFVGPGGVCQAPVPRYGPTDRVYERPLRR